jgi:hypothetical protein
MTEFLLFCIATVGMTSIITQGSIFQPFRQYIGILAEDARVYWEKKAKPDSVPRRSFVEWFNELINCAQCTGFWCGLFCGVFLVAANWKGVPPGLEGTGIPLTNYIFFVVLLRFRGQFLGTTRQ